MLYFHNYHWAASNKVKRDNYMGRMAQVVLSIPVIVYVGTLLIYALTGELFG